MKKALIIIGIIVAVLVGIVLIVFNALTLNKEKALISASTLNTIMEERLCND